jgi:hypothetical protein
MKVWAGHHVIFCNIWMDFKLSLIGFYEKVSMTKIKNGPKDAECKIDECLGWASCDFLQYMDGVQAFFDWVSLKRINDKN